MLLGPAVMDARMKISSGDDAIKKAILMPGLRASK
jgi:hypothetical protein